MWAGLVRIPLSLAEYTGPEAFTVKMLRDWKHDAERRSRESLPGLGPAGSGPPSNAAADALESQFVAPSCATSESPPSRSSRIASCRIGPARKSEGAYCVSRSKALPATPRAQLRRWRSICSRSRPSF